MVFLGGIEMRMRAILLWIIFCCLVACGGGGGGGGGGGSSPAEANSNPVLNLAPSFSVNEGLTQVTTVTASDANAGDSLSFTISGIDAGAFILTTGNLLSFSTAPNFSAPIDNNTDNSYQITVNVNDGAGGSDSSDITINVINLLNGRVVDAPLTGSSVFIDVNNNFIRDNNEPSTQTDANGNFTLADDQGLCLGTGVCAVTIIALGGQDTSTGTDLSNIALLGLAAANSDFVITPLTSVLLLSENDTDLLADLGLNSSSDEISLNDPWAGAIAGDLTSEAIQKINQQLGLLLQSSNSVNANTKTNINNARDLFNQLVNQSQLNNLDLTNAIAVATALQQASGNSISQSVIDAIANAVAEINSVMVDSSFRPSSNTASAIIATTQNKLQLAISDLVAGNISSNDFTAQNSASDLLAVAAQTATLIDTDNDGSFNLIDDDDDNDGVLDGSDDFPTDASESTDSDGDGVGNNADLDDDNDGVPDTRDPSPTDPNITPPTAIISLDANSGAAPLNIAFNANASLPGSSSINSFSWDFGDGSVGNGSFINHIYLTVGNFTATLTVSNGAGLNHQSSQLIIVSEDSGPFSVSGNLSVAANVAVDSDVNDSSTTPIPNNDFIAAQNLANPVILSGYLNSPGGGPDFNGGGNSKFSGDSDDFYSFNALGAEVINLNIAEPDDIDLDLILYDQSGTMVDFSLGLTRFETITVPQTPGQYFLQVTVFNGSGSNYVLNIGRNPALANHNWNAHSNIVPGQVIVREEDVAKNPMANMLGQSNIASSVEQQTVAKMGLYKFAQASAMKSLSEQAMPHLTVAPALNFNSQQLADKYWTLVTAKSLQQQKGVRYAEPNFYRHSSITVPNDELYPRQWHYPKIKLPAAWDISTGSDAVTVAVLDTGMVLNHPDFNGRLSDDGFDFISNPATALDGDGIDNDPSDPGDGRDNTNCTAAGNFKSSFHGTHVAGTIGANSDNGIGVSGVTWAGKIMPLRVLGCGGGSSFDIQQALLYAAGLANISGTLPSQPADIANLSLGGSGSSLSEQETYNAARQAGLIIIAAAGNNADNQLNYPAAYDGVISVAATTITDERAFYSSFGNTIDVSAPGGDTSRDLDGDGFIDGVLSSLAKINNGTIEATYEFYQGTSMATPHMAGVVALMKAVHPALSPADLDAVLSDGSITIDLGDPGRDDFFGHGRIDADKALRIANDLANGAPIPELPSLSLSISSLNFGRTLSQLSVNVFNSGNGDLQIDSVTSGDDFVSIISPNTDDGSGSYSISIDRSNLATGIFAAQVRFDSNAGSIDLPLIFEVIDESDLSLGDAGFHYVFLFDTRLGVITNFISLSASDGQYAYNFSDVDPAIYVVIAGSDPDNNGFICGPGEACGIFPTQDSAVEIIVNQNLSGIDFNTNYLIPVEAETQNINSQLPRLPFVPELLRSCMLENLSACVLRKLE